MRPLLLLNKGFYIPAGIVVNGNFVSEKEGGIEGTINGDVEVKATLTLEKKGTINGDLHAKDLIIKGHVNGNIYCEGRVCVLRDAVVAGNIFASECRIDKLSTVKGLVSHINPKREIGDNMSNGNAMEEISIPLAPANIVREEPPQSWF
jgi:cytoskeletal protein CcmA (bactofilin family)